MTCVQRALKASKTVLFGLRYRLSGASRSFWIVLCQYHQAATPRRAFMSRRFLHSGLDDVEDVEEYRPGGFHPVHLGDILGGRYKVLHKLGSGGFSTTWLVRDTAGVGYYALKILKAEETASSKEVQTLQRLGSLQTEHPGRKHIRSLISHFFHRGPNGQHTCLLTEVAGPSLQRLYNVPGHGYAAGSRRLRADIAHKIQRQLVDAVHFLHSVKTCHGDLTLANVLLALKSMDNLTEEEVYEQFGRPNTVKLVRADDDSSSDDSAPRYVVEPAGMLDTKYLKHEVLLVDFGEAFLSEQPPKHEDIGIPCMYRAPETMFESKLSLSSEIWSLGCILFEIRAGNPLFASIMGGQDEIILQMVQMKGKLPDQWWQRWDLRSERFDEEGKPLKEWPKGIPLAVEYPLDEMIEAIGAYDEDAAMFGSEVSMLEAMNTRVPAAEAESMRDLLESMLSWSPEERPSVEQVTQHPWLHA